MRRKLGSAMLGLLASAGLAGCAHMAPPPTPGCALTAYPLRVDAGQTQGITQGPGADFESVVRASMSAAPPADAWRDTGGRPSVLVLSGGSQHGAFGAGFFAGMAQVPDYKLVTGVSTGALQSTFLFLANSPVPADRRYPAYFPATAQHTNPGDLALAYSISDEGDLLNVGGHGTIGGVIRGSIGAFGPLRQVLAGLISPDTLRAIGREYRPDPREGRRLLVGVTNVNDGAGYAVDLTELAARFLSGGMPYEKARDCYVDAMIASSSVPLAVAPVTLEVATPAGLTRDLYIDGGARFGVFWSQLGELFETGLDPEVTLIVNGGLYAKPWLDKAGNPQREWSAISLGLRSVDILENQVYRFSVDNVQRFAAAKGRLKMAFISNQGLPAGAPDPDLFPFEGRTCGEWRAEDRKAKPTEFHPLYMRCLVAYGRARGAGPSWNLVR